MPAGPGLRAEGPGLLFCVLVALGARGISSLVPGLSTAATAILLGLLAGNLMPLRVRLEPGIRRAAGNGLELSIVLLGLTISLAGLPRFSALGGLLAVMACTLGAAALAGRFLGLGGRAGLLGGMGSAVCGSAAIAASAPLLRTSPGTVAAALASINLLSALGMFALPALASALAVGEVDAGWWTGGSLQAVGQAVAGGFAYSVTAGETATVVKLFRVATLVALLPALGLIVGAPGRGRLPWFVAGFMLAALLTAFTGPVDAARTPVAFLLATALAGIGARIEPRSLLTQGPRMLLLCALAFGVQFAGILVLIALGVTRG